MTRAGSESGQAGEGAPGPAAPRVSLGTGRALVPVVPTRTSGFAGLGRSHGVVAAGVAVAMGLGFVAGTAFFADRPQGVAVAQAAAPPDPTLDLLTRVQGEVRSLKASLDGLRATAESGRQEDTIRGLKRSVDLIKGDLEGVKTASTAAVGQLGAKLDRLDRDPGPKLNEIAARLDKLDRDPGTTKVAELTARLDRIERQVSSADATGSLPPQAAATAAATPKAPMPPQRAVQSAPSVPVAPVAAVPPARPDMTARAEPGRADPAKPEPSKAEPAPRAEAAAPRPEPAPRAEAAARPATVEGWMLRDVYGGVALLEGRSGGLREVAPGEYVPGVGEIRSIERRGRGWVVVTSRGIIQADNRW